MKIQIDMTKCSGFGTCADLAPSLFKIDEFGYPEIIGDGSVANADESQARNAACKCPEKAILVIEAASSLVNETAQ